MENKNKASIEQVLDNMDNNVVYKAKPSIVLSIVLIILGILFIVLNGKVTDAANSIISPLFITIGIVLLAWGVASIFFRKTKYKLAKNKQTVSFSELLFDVKERDKLIRVLNEGNVRELSKMKTSVNDALKLRVASTPDGSLCYTQVVTYIPFEFVNASEAHKHSQEEAKVILEMLKNKK